jgi:hypothetical protein
VRLDVPGLVKVIADAAKQESLTEDAHERSRSRPRVAASRQAEHKPARR